ncbi:hypothetical protein SAMN05428959_1011292 [Duganella sp. CF517]|uniref:hypothetical protein n=1 Tax=Duganella sp. CF517 TaxID=1881038 RepID=UPI0008CF6208|nr:hypothetical protein [Duganella sp. CF517]SEN34767.1 hypothetical protein SAMN05428959_1011292 [Duganella sp. CF517]
MSTRKKNADSQRQGKQKNNDKQEQQQPQQKRHTGGEGGPAQPSPTVGGLDLAAMMMIGDEHVVINGHEDDNNGFMAEFIDPL